MLTPEEIRQITGKSQPAAQIRHLHRMGIRAYRSDNPDNPVCVLREWLNAQGEHEAQSKPALRSDRGQTAQT